ncbi:hypothetical protein N7465_000258 [Penicillium sp. CMV-2018d]|nr:hypothetical protein N7465_000258 [Penicillium sp. CMV-2018d]
MCNDGIPIKPHTQPTARSSKRRFTRLPGRKMAADQHAQLFPGIGHDTRRSALGGGISTAE